MKKLVLFFMIFGSFIITSHASNDMMCTMEYAPVCAEVQVQCIQAPCPPIQETFSNNCMMKNNSFAKFLHDGECQPKGETSVEKPCTREYAPVCGQPKMPVCPEGMMCIQMMPAPKEYGNKCMMEADSATFLYKGNCIENLKDEKPLICTMEYAPVCGVNGITYSNVCKAGKVEIKYEGKCLGEKHEEKLKFNVDKLLQKTQNKINNPIQFVNVIEGTYKKIDMLAAKQEMFSLRQTAYLRIKTLFREYLQTKIFTPFIYNNISDISPDVSVVGGTWKVLNLEWDMEGIAYISYEDGHIQGNISGKVIIQNGRMKFIISNND